MGGLKISPNVRKLRIKDHTIIKAGLRYYKTGNTNSSNIRKIIDL